jgi:hypothetical protein
VNIVELDPHRGGQTVPLSLGALEVHSGSAAREAESRPRRTNVGGGKRRAEAGAKLITIQFAALLLVPLREPLLRQRLEFFLRQLAVLVLVALLHEARGEDHSGAESTRAASTAWTTRSAERSPAAILGLHCIPLIEGELELQGPDLVDLEEISAPQGARVDFLGVRTYHRAGSREE